MLEGDLDILTGYRQGSCLQTRLSQTKHLDLHAGTACRRSRKPDQPGRLRHGCVEVGHRLSWDGIEAGKVGAIFGEEQQPAPQHRE